MSAPLHNLIVVNERLRFGKAPYAVDRYFENLIKSNARRCYVFQTTAFLTGILLVIGAGLPPSELVSNRVLLAKLLLLLTLMSFLSIVHFGIQPRIEALLDQVQGEEIPPDIAAQLLPLRSRRKKLAGFCLFFVIMLVMLGIQVFGPFPPLHIGMLTVLAALFAWRVYKTNIPYGWV